MRGWTPVWSWSAANWDGVSREQTATVQRWRRRNAHVLRSSDTWQTELTYCGLVMRCGSPHHFRSCAPKTAGVRGTLSKDVAEDGVERLHDMRAGGEALGDFLRNRTALG